MKTRINMKIVQIGIGSIFVTMAACSPKAGTSEAKINDVAVPVALDSGYRVVAIGGKEPVRTSSPFISVVPYVELSPGKCRIDIEPKEGKGERESFYFSPDAGTTYRIIKADSGFTLVEDS